METAKKSGGSGLLDGVVARYLDCGILDRGVACVRCPNCTQELEGLDVLTECKYACGMITDLLGHEDYLRVLRVLERRSLRFTDIQRSLRLKPTQVDRAITFLKKALLIVPETMPAETGPIRVQYRLGRRGKGVLKAIDSLVKVLRRQPEFASEVAELQSLPD